jgi:SH3 domain-containing YSC84-like protein 1
MKKKRSAVLFVMSLFVALAFAQSEDQKGGSTERDRVKDSGQVLKQILDTPNESIPNNVLDGAKCVIILPSVKKVAIGIGGSYGRGVMTCRTGADYKGPWSAPIMMASSGGSIGLQIGGEATDFVITVMNDGGARSLLSSKVKLGADASVAAGPVGRTAEASTNGRMQAQMLSYSRSKGVFGGVSLSGSTLRPDDDANENLYGQKVTPGKIIAGKVAMPAEAQQLIGDLQKSPSASK